MKFPEITADHISELITRLERQGKSNEYIDGTLEGISFALEFYLGMIQLQRRKRDLIRQEQNVTA